MAGRYKFLTDNGLSTGTIWAWAKQLVQDLNSQDHSLSGTMSVPSGSVQTFAGAAPPVGWLLCDGGSYSKFDYPMLFTQIGYSYGGSGTNFNVPDFRNKFLIGAGSELALGESGGSATLTLTASNVSSQELTSLDILDGVGDAQLLSGKTSSGASPTDPINIMPPAVGINIIIKV